MLRIIISPAKKMNVADDYPVEAVRPRFLEQSEALKYYLRGLDYGTLKEIWKCNDKIAELNWGRLRDMDLQRRLTPAVFAYEGIQYQSMAPGVLEREALVYIGEHLYILSGFYGILRAFDGVVPYRLEMQARLAWERECTAVSSLYDYWGDSLSRVVTEAPKEDGRGGRREAGKEAVGQEDGGSEITIVNLASKEYSKAVEPWLTPEVRYITCVFGEIEARDQAAQPMEKIAKNQAKRSMAKTAEDQAERVRVKATAAKMARGAMVRFMAENQVTQPEQLKAFDRMEYRYLEHLSDDRTYVFGTEKT